MNNLQRRLLIGGLLALGASSAWADVPTQLDTIEITATREPEPVGQVPASVSVVSGAELRARGATDLRTALSLVAGADAPAGGDTGPAGAVPSFWGLHEFDAFLLVVDGVPWGGAFNPSIPTLDLNNVERIEVLKGAAPVVYGATAFVGVVHVIHYPAGQAANQAQIGYGSHGSLQGSAALALPALGEWQQSLSLSGEHLKFADPREGINNGKFLYRGAAPLLGGTFRTDADVTLQHQLPSSPSILISPIDANYNPADARIDEHRYHLVLGYSRDTAMGLWDTTASFAHSGIRDIRGFLRSDPTPNPDNTDPDFGNNADYQNQDRGIIDSYFDTHFTKGVAQGLDLVYGADLLYGYGKQTSANGAYCAGGAAYACPAGKDQMPPQATTDRPVDEINTLNDRRSFAGAYVQMDWKPSESWDVNGGLRLNQTHEANVSTHTDTADATADTYDSESKNKTRLSGTIGTSYRIWSSGMDEAVAYADYRNAFKPAAIDFGPDVPFPSILEPETARSYEAGIKGHLLEGLIEYDASLFYMDFNNLVVVDHATGNFENAGTEHFKGIELETRYHLYKDLSAALNYSYHDARFANFIDDDGTDVSGKQLDLSPHHLASLGLMYTRAQGFNATVVANYVGSRYLDRANTQSTPAYTTLDGSVGYRWQRYGVTVNGYNLSNERKPVSASEFGEGSFYILPARSVMMNLSLDL